MKESILVIGCGVIGLSSAIRLREQGFSVKMIARDFPPHTTSNRAAAIWLPFLAEPRERVIRWSRRTYEVFETLSQNEETGVKMVELLDLHEETQPPLWQEVLSSEQYQTLDASDYPTSVRQAYQLRAPMIDTSVYLPFLLRYFQSLGGELEKRELQNLEEITKHSDWVINCSGLGARELVADAEVYPIRGHMVEVEANQAIPWLNHDHTEGVTYILPRQKTCILGGSVEPQVENPEVNEAMAKNIWEQAVDWVPALKEAKILNKYVGFRPGRSQIRLEKVPHQKLIHHYGHGGSGFTVSWGCAEAVCDLVRSA